MPTEPADRLNTIAARLLQGAGASEHEAATVARHCVDANLAGHDSHGIIQIPTYIDRVNEGHIVPGAELEIVKDTPTTTVVNGNWGFGYVVSERAMEATIAKARESNLAARDRLPTEPRRARDRLPADGRGGWNDRHNDRRLRPHQQVGRTVRGQGAPSRYQPDSA